MFCEHPGHVSCNNEAVMSVTIMGKIYSLCKSCYKFWTGKELK